ncbi:MAG: helix-turn-helix domain-containing protein [Candidatus Ornithomonoglobus sp.]
MAKGKFEYWLTADGLLRLGAWARDGLTDEQIAKNIGISRSTLNEWKKRFSDISDTLKRNKDIADIEVENALHKRATGYKTVETTRELAKNPETGEAELVITKQVTKEIPPETAAAIFWLKNRKPDTWHDKREVKTSATEDAVADKLNEVFGDAP